MFQTFQVIQSIRPLVASLVIRIPVVFSILTSVTDAATPMRKAVIGHAALNARVAPLWVAEDHGFFVKHGVNAYAIFIRQAPVLVAALTAGATFNG